MLHVIPARHTKVIHFIRHGQGFHNVAGQRDAAEYLSYDYEDAHLTEYGWTQAEALNRHIGKLPQALHLDVVVVSPLTRAIETAVGAFSQRQWQQGEAKAPLMLAQTAEDGKRPARPAMSAAACPPFVCVETCREHLGRHPCDRRQPASHYRKHYPAVDFSLIETEEDVLWKREEREPKEHITARGLCFMQWLMQRPEARIAVVTHSSFLYYMMSQFGHAGAPLVKGELHRWYENCEMRTVVLSDSGGGGGNLDDLWFPGGHQQPKQGVAYLSNGTAA
ncbi:hypothetical protein WJX72_010435 [[Myrmecia] bisecta]|uniref:Phosphoglycerate mutase-like protein n=1 Tax=[Myrmecia] bisecta TaxID=41462 RepID=A0AAW1R918_9CHLO